MYHEWKALLCLLFPGWFSICRPNHRLMQRMQIIAHRANVVAALQWYRNKNNNQLFHLMESWRKQDFGITEAIRAWNTVAALNACLGFRFWCKVWIKTSPASFFSFHSCRYIQKIALGTFLMLIVNHDWSAALIKMSNGQVSLHIWWDRRPSGIDLNCSIKHYHIVLVTCTAKHIDKPTYI